MKRLKRFTVMLAVLLVAVLLPTEAKADYKSGDWTYTLYGSDATITKYFGDKSEISIPEAIDGNEVIAIGANAFKDLEGLISVTIPSSVVSIGESAFNGCGQLRTLSIAESSLLRSIGNYAFFGCDSLELVEFPKKLETVGYRAFYGTESLAEVIVNSTNLNDFDGWGSTFYNAGKDSESFKVVFAEGVTRIPANMFRSDAENPAYITKVILSSTVEEVGGWAFENCTSLNTVDCTNASGLKSIGESAFNNCVQMEKFTIAEPSMLRSIGSRAFFGCSSLKLIVLPEKLADVGYRAFYGTEALTEIIVNSIKLNDFDGWGDTFYNAGRDTESVKVVFAEGVTRIPTNMFRSDVDNPAYVTEVILSSTVEEVGGWAFENCIALNTVDYTNASGLKSIGESAFNNCERMEAFAITEPSALRSIGSRAFFGCDSLKRIELPKKLENVGYRAFYGTEALTEIIVNSIKLNDFDGWGDTFYNAGRDTESVKVVFAEGVTRIPTNMFRSDVDNPAYVTEVILSSTVEEMGGWAFENCIALNTVDYTNASGLKSIGESTFNNCERMEAFAITEPSALRSIGSNAFFGCDSLKCIELPEKLENVGYRAFYGTEKLEKITVRSIKLNDFDAWGGTFYNAGKENEDGALVLFEDTVTRIPANMFYSTSSTLADYPRIKTVIISENVEEVGNVAFKNCSELKSLTFRSKTCDIYDDQFTMGNPEVTVLYGVQGSTLQAYAEKYGYKFICECDHDVVINKAVEPTCEESGLTEGSYCSLCGEVFVAQELLPAVGHREVTMSGYEASCILDGLTEGVKCIVCNEVLEKQEKIPAKGHNFHKGECVVCGAFDAFVNPFIDVKDSDWFYISVVWAVQNNVTGGTSSVTFSPNDGCTRAQVVTFLWAANGKPEPKSMDNPFIDVANDAWYLKPVLWAVENGITGGVAADKFGPEQTCTRAQIVTFLYAAAGKPAVSGNSDFKDVGDTDWFAAPVIWAAQNEVTGGIGDGKFGPEQTCTRCQVVTFLYKVYG